MSQDYKETLRGLNLEGDTPVMLTYTDGCDVFVHNDTAVEDALNDTDVVRRFSDLVAALGGDTFQSVIDALVDAGILDDPADADEEADPIDAGMISDAIDNNFYDQELIEHSIKKYDHKRGHCTLTATVETTLEQVLGLDFDLSGWELEVKMKKGKMSITC